MMTDTNLTIADRFFKQALLRPDAPAVSDETRSLTYRELAGAALSLADSLDDLTDKPRIGVALPSCTAFPCSLLGIIASGRVCVPINLLFSPELMQFVVQDSGLDTIITTRQLEGKLQGLAPQLVFVEDMSPRPTESRPASTEPDDPAMVIYTSGTMGRPKGVVLSRRSIVRNVETSVERFDYGPEDTTLGVLPPFHVFASVCTVLLPLLHGGRAFYLPRFNPGKVLSALAEHDITTVFGVPAMYRALLRALDAAGTAPHSLRFCVSGGEALPPALAEAFEQAFGVPLLQGYGMTETAPVIALNPVDAPVTGSVGLPLSWAELRFIDEQGADVHPGEEGELCIRGDCVMSCYLNNTEATAESMDAECWFRTGDIARLDDQGYLYITGRKKELIISGGENISPVEVESVIAGHPAVADVGVVAAPDEVRGEVPKAFVVLRPGVECSRQDIMDHCREHLARVKRPGSVVFIDEMPRSPTGKLLRRLLLQRA